MTLDVYAATGAFPRHELFALTGQLRRSASSIPANIAMGSASELSYHVILARGLGYLPPDRYERLALDTEEIKRMLATFAFRLRNRPPRTDG